MTFDASRLSTVRDVSGSISGATFHAPPTLSMAAPVRLEDVARSKYFPTFDGIRTVGIALLIAGHAGYPVAGLPGDLGVSAFFVLSGFLITRIIMREHDETGTVSLKTFYARRTLRIFPAYYFYIIVSFAIDWVKNDRWSTAQTVSAFGYMMNYFNAVNNHPGTELAHAWSLAVEEQFYLLWPLAFLLLAKRGRRALTWALVGSIVVVMSWRSYLFLSRTIGSAWAYNAFDCRFDNLAIGCLLAVTIDNPRVLAAGKAVANRVWYPLITLAVLVVLRKLTSVDFRYSIGFTIYAALLAVFFVQVLQLYTTKLWSWLENPAIRYIGNISYPMYLWHIWGDSVGRHFPIHGRLAEFVVQIVATILLGTGSYFCIERPFLVMKAKYTARRRPQEGLQMPGILRARDAVLPGASSGQATGVAS